MIAFTHAPASARGNAGDDLDARCARIRARMLDRIDAMLDELAQPDAQRDSVARAVEAQVAPLSCRLALCRRARRCRKRPCQAFAPNARGM